MDYKAIKEVQELIAGFKKLKEQRDSVINFEQGKKLQLTVEIVDAELANAILVNSFGDGNSLPGMKIEDIRFDDLERKDVIEDYLLKQLQAIKLYI